MKKFRQAKSDVLSLFSPLISRFLIHLPIILPKIKRLNYKKPLTISRFFLFLLLPGILAGCGSGSNSWGWHVLSPWTPAGFDNFMFLVNGFFYTIGLSFSAMFLSVLLGFVLMVLGLYGHQIARLFAFGAIEVLRSIPILVMLLWVYYGLPITLGIQFSPFWAGVLALALVDSAFEAEIFRGGVRAVSKEQTLAAQSLGLNFWQVSRYIVLPQAFRIVLPSLGNQYIYVLKMSSLASIIGVMELTRRANELVTITYRPLEIYTILVLEYLVLVLFASYVVRTLERRYKKRD